MLLIVCAGAVVVLRFILPRMMGNKRWNKEGHFELISRFGLDIRKSLYLVRVGKKFFLLGGAEQGLHLLSEVSEEDLGEFGEKKSK